MSLFKKAMLAVVTFVLALVAFVAPVRHAKVEAAHAGETWGLAGSFNNWNPNNNGTVFSYDEENDTYFLHVTLKANDEFKVVKNKSWGTEIGHNSAADSSATSQFNSAGGNWKVKTTGDYILKIDRKISTSNSTLYKSFKVEKKTEAVTGKFNAYFANSGNWAKVYTHRWGKSVTTNWPGTEITKDSSGYYVIKDLEPGENIIFNNGSGTQTANLVAPSYGNNLFVFDGSIWTLYNPEIIKHTVSFDTGTGEKINDIVKEDGQSLSLAELPMPTVNGYPFEGWYTDSNCENAYVEGKINSDMKLYAKWGTYNGIATSSKIRLFFENTLGWSTVNVYYWGTEKDPVWPGSAASRLGETNVYYIDIKADGIIFNNGTAQTVDIKPAELESTFVKPGSKDGDKYTVVSAVEASMNVYFQTKANGENFDMRLVGTLGDGSELDISNYSEVGFMVLDPNSSRTVAKASSTVYTSVEANGSVISAEALEATYVFVLTVTNVPAGEKFFVVPYAIDVDGNYVIGTSKTFIVL